MSVTNYECKGKKCKVITKRWKCWEKKTCTTIKVKSENKKIKVNKEKRQTQTQTTDIPDILGAYYKEGQKER